MWDNHLGFYEGVLLFALFAVFIIAMLRISRNEQKNGDALLAEQESENTARREQRKSGYLGSNWAYHSADCCQRVSR
ncbi:hypothetical protein [Vibrio sp. J502]|uniref:hypothetical protein n=1 Tax=Vibrio sp. J502 TaxID=2978741 RepID=UPI0039657E51